MAGYFATLVSFDLPDDVPIHDRTVQLLEITRGAVPLALTIETAPLRRDAPFDRVVRDGLDARRCAVPGLVLLSEQEREADGVSVLDYRLRFRGEGGLAYERQAHLTTAGRHLTVAISSSMEDATYADSWFEHTLRTMRLRAS